MAKRINITLPESTIKQLHKIAKPGERSMVIKEAIEHYVATKSPEAIRKLMIETAIRDRDLDKAVYDDWKEIDDETWPEY